MTMFFDKEYSIGQMIDEVCRVTGIKQVTQFDDVEGTQLRAVISNGDEWIQIEMGVKMKEIKDKYFEGRETQFDQGDTIKLVRQNEN